jgi:hypothetical protein
MTLRAFGHVARIVMACLLVGGCGGPQFQPLNRTTLRASQPRSIVAANLPLHDFVVGANVSGGWALLGPAFMVGAALVDTMDADQSEAKLRRGTPLADPALKIRASLLEGMARRFSLQIANSGPLEPNATSPAGLATHYKGIDLILDVRTSDWGLRSFGAGNYGVSYDGTLTLVDGRTGQIVAQGICTSHPVTLSDGPSRQKLTAEDATLMRETVAAITNECVEDYRKRVLGLY